METIVTGIAPETSARLRQQVRGAVLLPDDAGYDEARALWNAMHDKRPAVIVRATGVADVIAAVRFARENDLLLAIKGGGHSLPGFSCCDDGLMLDLSLMKGIRVDPARHTVRAQGGVLWGDLDHETQAFGLAVTGGQVSHTGIAGLTLGGGIGNLMRTCGATVDNLIGADVVTADGRLIHASADENPDLFWALRGGGGNFGVVTEFEYKLHPIGPLVTGGMIAYRAADAAIMLEWWRERMAQAPDDLQIVAVFLTAPPAPFVPAPLHFQQLIAFIICHTGAMEDGQKALDDLRAFRTPALDMAGPIPYTMLQTLIDEPTAHGQYNYVKSGNVRDVSDEVLETIRTYASTAPSPYSVVILVPYGGALSRVGEMETAFGHRDSACALSIFSVWRDPDQIGRNVAWTRYFHDAVKPWLHGAYVNELGDTGEEQIRAAYKQQVYDRLVEIKTRYDPTNLFRLNQNIAPAPSPFPAQHVPGAIAEMWEVEPER